MKNRPTQRVAAYNVKMRVKCDSDGVATIGILMSQKNITACAETRAIQAQTLSTYLPITHAQIALEAITAAKARAANLHLHACDPAVGRPTPSAAVFREFLFPIGATCDAIINITLDGAKTMKLHQRLKASLEFEPELSFCRIPNIGSLCTSVGAE